MPPVGAYVSVLSVSRDRTTRRAIPLHTCTCPPFLPIRLRPFERHDGIDRLWRRQMRLAPHEHKGHLKSLANTEVGDGSRILPTQLHRRAKPHRVGTRHGHQICIDPTYPGHDVSVIEPQPQVHAHGYAPADAFNDADDVHGLTADRHEVDQPDSSLIGVNSVSSTMVSPR